MKKMLFLFCFMIFAISCATLPFQKDYHIRNTPVELGAIGKNKKELLQKKFQLFAIPNYENKIRVNIAFSPFTKSLYNRYRKSITIKKANLVFNDSINPKPNYIEIEIIDKVTVVSTLNNDTKLLEYIKESSDANIVTSIRLTSDITTQSQLQQADAYYLKTDKHLKQWLLLYNKGKEILKIDLLQANIFEYKLSSFCWKKTKKREVLVATIIGENEECNAQTKNTPKELEEKTNDDYFDF